MIWTTPISSFIFGIYGRQHILNQTKALILVDTCITHSIFCHWCAVITSLTRWSKKIDNALFHLQSSIFGLNFGDGGRRNNADYTSDLKMNSPSHLYNRLASTYSVVHRPNWLHSAKSMYVTWRNAWDGWGFKFEV